ncbi:MAG: Fe-S cluster assembly protein SufB, partial [Acidobacteriota bacterium]|nr:Fe-S cluster assembly protein SufB [Acidobacteriota bacterium]
MSTAEDTIRQLADREYKWGFVTDIEADAAPPGLNEEIIRFISLKKKEPQWMLDWRLEAYRGWLKTTEPTWPHVTHAPIDYQAACYYSAPKRADAPKSL